MLASVFFFFSSRRRHTRFDCDWSSDVCSSDLHRRHPPARRRRCEHLSWDRSPARTPQATIGLRQDPPRVATRRCPRSEEHTSELQSQSNLVCRLLLEKKKQQRYSIYKVSTSGS